MDCSDGGPNEEGYFLEVAIRQLRPGRQGLAMGIRRNRHRVSGRELPRFPPIVAIGRLIAAGKRRDDRRRACDAAGCIAPHLDFR